MTKHYPTLTYGDTVLRNVCFFDDPESALKRVKEIYRDNTQKIKQEYKKLLAGEPLRLEILEDATYPFIGFQINVENAYKHDSHYSYGVIGDPGRYGTTLTNPDLFAHYYLEQFKRIMENHNVAAIVGESTWKIPFPYVLDLSTSHLSEEQLESLKTNFMMPDLRRINDDIANSTNDPKEGAVMPLSLFSGERVDYSLHRLHHYTGTTAQHFQQFILLTNYQRYVPDFLKYAFQKIREKDSEYEALIVPGGTEISDEKQIEIELERTGYDLPQMPAYHLKRKDNNGVTFINIGVGPSNAKTITDHLSVLRPHCWLMVGHCGGLRRTQALGDYVMAHAYLRDDQVLDADLPSWVPIPPIAEIQVALQDAIAEITELDSIALKTRARTGTVATSNNRNWELRTKELYQHFRQSRAIAIDIESATVAANGFRFRVPYGTLLCVSDKPVHGEIKLRGMANQFYQKSVKQHLQIGLKTVEILRRRGVAALHSRKLRGFHEVPFR